MRRRAETGLLGGFMEFPSTDWPPLPGLGRHGFTHFELGLGALDGRAGGSRGLAGIWCWPEAFEVQALLVLMK